MSKYLYLPLLLLSFSSLNLHATQTFFPVQYTAPVGIDFADAQHRMNNKYKRTVNNAFELLEETGFACKGQAVVDFGCGLGTASSLIREFIGSEGSYTGIDAIPANIYGAITMFSSEKFLHGEQDSPHVKAVLAQADIVFMRLVTMYQMDGMHEKFLEELIAAMKPGAYLIDIEPAGTDDQRSYLRQRYGDALNVFWDHKANMEKKKGTNFDIAASLKKMFQKLTPVPVIEQAYDSITTMKEGKKQLRQFIKTFTPGEVSAGFVEQDVVANMQNVVENLPEGPDDFWYNNRVFTFVVRKAAS